MFKLKAPDGTNNLCAKSIKEYRQAIRPKMSQRTMAKKLQLMGYDLDYHAIQDMESGKRFITDIEIKILCEFFQVSSDSLLAINQTLKNENTIKNSP